MAQDRVVALANARERLVAHCHVVPKRLAEDWKPWSAHDVDKLIQVGGAITVLNRLIKEEPTVGSAQRTMTSLSQARADHIGT